MIKKINNSSIFLDICNKLKYVPDCKLTQDKLYNYMIAGIYTEKVLTFASHDEKMNGCAVLTIGEDITGDKTLFLFFIWIDPHYQKLWKEYLKFVEQKAKEFECKKISFFTVRSEKVIDRYLGKFGYKKVYNVIEKEVV